MDFTYPNDVHLSFSSTQFGAYGGFDAGLKMFGALGMATVPYSGPVQIIGANAWKWQDSTNRRTWVRDICRKWELPGQS